jgi:hypothetical protein
MGEARRKALARVREPIALDTFGGRVHVEWDPAAAVTPLGQLPFFIEFLKVSGLFDAFVEDCPLTFESNNAPTKREVLATLMLSVLAGHYRYAHINALRHDQVHSQLLGCRRFVSEDSARRSLYRIEEAEGTRWLDHHLHRTTRLLLATAWICDLDATVKPLYGKQQGALIGYNPMKPGRPSHCYHSAFMANTRIALNVDVAGGNRTAASYAMPAFWRWFDQLKPSERPALLRGDVAFGNEAVMTDAEVRRQPYLYKLRLTAGVKRLVRDLFGRAHWQDAGQEWEGTETMLRLTGWSAARRVVVLRRALRGEMALEARRGPQAELAFIEANVPTARYEYAVLVTSTALEILTLAQLYRDRADCENNFDELKNQWGWGGFTTHDLKRCRLMARLVALVYNWWNLFARLANPNKHHEAITSRPLLLHGVATQTKHANQTRLVITSTHAKSEHVQAVLTELARFLKSLTATAEQLTDAQRLSAILKRAFAKFMHAAAGPPGTLALENMI